MHPKPESEARDYKAAGKLEGKVALISGGDSGIGKSVAVHFAKEGADIAILYLEENEDADRTRMLVEREGRRCLLLQGDVGDRNACDDAIRRTLEAFGKLNNAAEQQVSKSFDDIPAQQLEQTFRTNLFGIFFLTQGALPHLKKGAAIVNTTSIAGFKGNPSLVDYSATKQAIVALTRSLSMQLVEQGIRVNAVAPGPIWTPLIPASFDPKHVAEFGADTPMKRPVNPTRSRPAMCFWHRTTRAT